MVNNKASIRKEDDIFTSLVWLGKRFVKQNPKLLIKNKINNPLILWKLKIFINQKVPLTKWKIIDREKILQFTFPTKDITRIYKSLL